jgi:hypothetical protein
MNKRQPGRPKVYTEPMGQASILLTLKEIEYLKSQPCGMSEFIRRLVEKSMKESKEGK